MAGARSIALVMPARSAATQATLANESRRALAPGGFSTPLPVLSSAPREFGSLQLGWTRQIGNPPPSAIVHLPLTLTNGFQPRPPPAVARQSFRLRESAARGRRAPAGGGDDEARRPALPSTTTGRAATATRGVRAGGIRAAELAPLLPSLFLVDLDRSAGIPLPLLRRRARHALRPRPDRRELPRALERRRTGRRCSATSASSPSRSTGLVAGVMAETVGGGFTSFEMLLLPLAGETRHGRRDRLDGADRRPRRDEPHPRPHRRAVAALDPLPAARPEPARARCRCRRRACPAPPRRHAAPLRPPDRLSRRKIEPRIRSRRPSLTNI